MAGRTRVSSRFESCGLAGDQSGRAGQHPATRAPTLRGEPSGFWDGPLGRRPTDCPSPERLRSPAIWTLWSVHWEVRAGTLSRDGQQEKGEPKCLFVPYLGQFLPVKTL